MKSSGQGTDSAPALRLSCGRRVSFADYGAHDGRPVIALHGTPGSRLKFAGAAEAAAQAAGLRLIALDRWGYGDTDAPDAPSLAAYAADVAEIADRAGLERFAVIGISGGGPYAAAIAAVLGDRVAAAALVSPVGPIAGIDPAPSLGLHHHMGFRILPRLPAVLAAGFGALGLIARHRPELAARIAAARAPAADQAIARDRDFALHLGRAFAAGLARGGRGAAIDLRLFGRPWGIGHAATTAPTRIWLGDQDRNVPLEPVTALHAALSTGAAHTTLTTLPGQGHFWIARNFTQVLGWIAAEFG